MRRIITSTPEGAAMLAPVIAKVPPDPRWGSAFLKVMCGDAMTRYEIEAFVVRREILDTSAGRWLRDCFEAIGCGTDGEVKAR